MGCLQTSEPAPDTVALQKPTSPRRRTETAEKFVENAIKQPMNKLGARLDKLLGEVKHEYEELFGTIDDQDAFRNQRKLRMREISTAHLIAAERADAESGDDDIGDNDNDGNDKFTVQRHHTNVRGMQLQDMTEDMVAEIMALERDPEIVETFWQNITWDFDVIALAQHAKVKGHCLALFAWHIIHKNEFEQRFHVSPHKLINFLLHVESSYRHVPYHNKYHATEVVHNVYWLLTHSATLKSRVTAFDVFVTIMAAAMHDVDHDGRNNAWHKHIESRLALKYENTSILENHHISFGFSLMRSKKYDCDWIGELDAAHIDEARWMLIQLILGTDMAAHKEHQDEVKQLSEKLKAMSPITEEEIGDGSDDNSDDDGGGVVSVELTKEEKLTLLEVTLHAADIGNASKCWDLGLIWGRRVIDEFRAQGDEEKKRFGKESQKLFQRDYALELSQSGWIQFVMLPFSESFNTLLNGDIADLINNLHENNKRWKEYKEFL